VLASFGTDPTRAAAAAGSTTRKDPAAGDNFSLAFGDAAPQGGRPRTRSIASRRPKGKLVGRSPKIPVWELRGDQDPCDVAELKNAAKKGGLTWQVHGGPVRPATSGGFR
jgi:hypothetical protein